jgi:enoyl-[acyl-carrier protein] reductase I
LILNGFDVFFDFAQMMSPLGNATAEDCANYISVMFSDFTRMVTMQNLMHDGGFSSSGITQQMVDRLSK